jgi:hypothetical protein
LEFCFASRYFGRLMDSENGRLHGHGRSIIEEIEHCN